MKTELNFFNSNKTSNSFMEVKKMKQNMLLNLYGAIIVCNSKTILYSSFWAVTFCKYIINKACIIMSLFF